MSIQHWTQSQQAFIMRKSGIVWFILASEYQMITNIQHTYKKWMVVVFLVWGLVTAGTSIYYETCTRIEEYISRTTLANVPKVHFHSISQFVYLFFYNWHGLLNLSLSELLTLRFSVLFSDTTDEVPSNWSRLPGQMCKLPNSPLLSLPAGKMGCLVMSFSHDGRYGSQAI